VEGWPLATRKVKKKSAQGENSRRRLRVIPTREGDHHGEKEVMKNLTNYLAETKILS